MKIYEKLSLQCITITWSPIDWLIDWLTAEFVAEEGEEHGEVEGSGGLGQHFFQSFVIGCASCNWNMDKP